MRGIMVIADGWEGTGKTTFLKKIVNRNLGQYLKPSNQNSDEPLNHSSIEMMEKDLEPGGLFDQIDAILDTGKLLLIDRLWPSAYAYGVWRGEDPIRLLELCLEIEERFRNLYLHLHFTARMDHQPLPKGIASQRDKDTILNAYSHYYMNLTSITPSNYFALNTAPWLEMDEGPYATIWELSTLSKILEKVGVLLKIQELEASKK